MRNRVMFGITLILVLALAGCTSGGAGSGSSANGVGPDTGSTETPSLSSTGPGGVIVFRRTINGSYFGIDTIKPDGTDLAPLTPTPAGDNDTHPWPSPDGSQVVFARYINGNHNTSPTTDRERDVLMVVNADGSGLHELMLGCTGACAKATGTKGCAPPAFPCDDYPSWSPDGTRIAFERAYGSNLYHLTVAIWVANADGSHARQLTQAPAGWEEHSPSWSPDSTHIVFDRFDDLAPNGGQGYIYTIGADGKGLRLVYRVPSKWPGGGADPRWSPDGSKILFSDFCFWGSPEGCPADTPKTGAHLFTIRPDGSGLTELTHGSMNELFPAWSPDGRWIVFSRTVHGFDGSPDMFLMRADGSDVQPILDSGCPCLAEWGIGP